MTLHLSLLFLDPRDRQALRDLRCDYDMHRTLLRAFPDADAGGAGAVRFRVEPLADDRLAQVLVQSEKPPDWSRLPDGYLAELPSVKLFDPPRFAVGRQLRFRLRANPVKRLRGESVGPDGQPVEAKWHGKRVGLRQEAEQRAWLDRKAEAAGFRVLECQVSSTTDRSRRHDHVMTHVEARFDGVLEVRDPAAFQAALRSGIGSAKGFGFGLLSVAPV
jgi:CRISPR system Cascade subunit CasE